MAATRWQTFRQVVLPAAAPAIFTGIYLALIYSWLATIGAEYLLVAGVGIGNLLIEGSEHFQMDLVIFGMFVVGTIGWLTNASARLAERRLCAAGHYERGSNTHGTTPHPGPGTQGRRQALRQRRPKAARCRCCPASTCAYRPASSWPWSAPAAAASPRCCG